MARRPPRARRLASGQTRWQNGRRDPCWLAESDGRRLAGAEGRGERMGMANEQTQGASAEKTGERRTVEKASAGNVEVEYATIEAAEIAQTLEKDRRMLVFGEDRLLFLADAVFAI